MLASDRRLDEASRARVSYVAVGATSDPNLLRFPPAGYVPFERRARIGYGDRRWEFAVDELMSWRVKTRAGFRIRRAAAGDHEGDATFSADGTPYATPGETAVLRPGILPFREPVRVISVIDEEDRRGFTYGTLPGHPLEGEEQLMVVRREDGAVYLVVRSFARPASWPWMLLRPVLAIVRRIVVIRYTDALSRSI